MFNYISEAYLDKEEKFWDYKTSDIDGSNIFDTKHTGTSFYDQFLGTSELEYLKNKHNLEGKIIYMTPQEYYDACATKIFNTTADRLKQQRAADVDTINHLKEVILKYKRKFPIAYINYAEEGQEGLHRMYVAGELFGWDVKHPVLEITHADSERAEKEAKQKIINEIEIYLRRAIQEALQYEYRNIEEFKEQLGWSLDSNFKYSSYVETPVEFKLEDQHEIYLLKVGEASSEIRKDSIKIKNDSDDDFDIDDADLSDEDIDFLKRYFGDDWETDFLETGEKLKNNKH